MSDLQQTYENTPYPSFSYTQTHPDRLATIAAILGLTPPPIEQCRVLEIGCASGGNLIPMATTLPRSEFVGIDFSARQIEAGQEVITGLGLTNVRLLVQDILQITADFGPFDYIIAHGIYSWVPPEVREKLLQLCQQNLSPQGLAYISYNTYPGWHMMGALREMMLFHTRHLAEGPEKVTAARELLHFLGEAVPSSDETFLGAYGTLIKAYGKFVDEQRQEAKAGDELLLHDELELFNQPVYFHEFMAQAGQYGLQYVAEADFAMVMPNGFEPGVVQQLMKLAKSTVELEQYMDFLRNRTLRQTLLCHEAVTVNRRLQPSPELMRQFYVASWARPMAQEVDVAGKTAVSFQASDGAMFTTDHPLTKAALLLLGRLQPTAVAFDELVVGAQAFLGQAIGEQDVQVLAVNLLRGFSYSFKLVELHKMVLPFVEGVSERPLASPLSRYQVQNNLRVVNQRHERVNLDKISLYLLPFLDGTRTPDDLLALLLNLVAEGTIQVKVDEAAGVDTAVIQHQMAQELQSLLNWLSKAALLVG
ncbi:MAG: methyltransferase regulatory domain-containing protein [Ardenticatenaceae bacterium]|nr:methyltransferase regulatory domain-containing protein [Ardenticatenaceae bacterium]